MTSATPIRSGANNGDTDKKELFLKVFAGEVLTTFETETVFLDKHQVRSISSGKSAQFPVVGWTAAAYHTPGTELTGQDIGHTEKTISIDDLLVSDHFIAKIDEAMNHFDVRSEYSKKAGHALAKTYDSNVARLSVLAARAAASLTSGNGGSALTHANFRTDGDQLAAGVFEAAQKLDEKDVPEGDRYCAIKPAQYYLLVQTTKVINRDWGGAGVYAEGKVLKAAGISFVKTNQLPTTVVSTGPAAYQGTFTNTAGVVWHRDAVGTVKLLDLSTEAEWDIRRQGTLLVAKYAMGHGILRPECAVELKVA